MELISVIVVGHNGQPFLQKCLESLFNQTYGNLEIIYVDNASSDSSLDFVQQFPLKTVPLSTNRGYTGGCNVGLSHCAGSLVLFVNQDIIAAPTLVSELSNHLCEPNVAIVYPYIADYQDYPKANSIRCPLHFLPQIGALMFGEPSHEPQYVNFATGTAFMIRKPVLQDIGGYLFDERLFMYYEDVDLSIRTIARGYSIKWIPTTCVWHRFENSSLLAAYLSMRNIHLVILKNFGYSYYLQVLPWILHQHLFLIRHFKKRHGVSITRMFPLLVKAYFEAICMLDLFRPTDSTQDAIDAYTKICPRKHAKEVLRDFQRKVILYG